MKLDPKDRLSRATETRGRVEAQRQWENNPCGADTDVSKPRESLDWFREVRKHRYEEYAPWLLAATGIAELRDKCVLEIGVGVGSDHLTLAQGGNSMTALDLSREHLRLTARHLDLEGFQTNTVHGDMEKMPFADGTFDAVYCFGVLHHTDHMERAVAEFRRVLRPGGTVIVSVYHRDSIYFWLGLILINGVLRGWLFRYGWRRTLARIESGAGDDFVPQVHLLTRRSLRRLFGDFQVDRLEVDHIGMPSRVQQMLSRPARLFLEKSLKPVGWYLTLRATKK